MKKALYLPAVLLLAVGLVVLFSHIFGTSHIEPPGIKSTVQQTETKEPPSDPTRRFLIVGEVWAPFEYKENGRLVGIDIDVFNRIFPKLGIKHEVKLYPWSRAKMMAENGEADAVVSVSHKVSRESFIHYSASQRGFTSKGTWPWDYLWESEYVFFCRKLTVESLKFESYEQIRRDGYRVGLVRDYSYNPEFRASGLGDYTAPDVTTGMKLLDDGKYDLFPADKTIGSALLKRLSLSSRIVRLPKGMFRKPYLLVACKKSDWPNKAATMKRFYEELEGLRKSGEYDRICAKYFD